MNAHLVVTHDVNPARLRGRAVLAATSLALILVACGPGSGDGRSAAAAAADVHCTLTHRDNVTEPIQDRQEITVAPGERHTVNFDAFVVDLVYDVSEQEGAALRVAAHGPGETEPLVQHLYQFTDEVPEDFAGATGFTGLTYVYPPDTDAEVQYLCSASAPDDA